MLLLEAKLVKLVRLNAGEYGLVGPAWKGASTAALAAELGGKRKAEEDERLGVVVVLPPPPPPPMVVEVVVVVGGISPRLERKGNEVVFGNSTWGDRGGVLGRANCGIDNEGNMGLVVVVGCWLMMMMMIYLMGFGGRPLQAKSPEPAL